MTTAKFKKFFTSPTVRLAETYLAIIMVMSVGFSLVFLNISYRALNRQLPPKSFFRHVDPGQLSPQAEFTEFFEHRVSDARNELLMKIALINAFVLIIGAEVSYLLARRALQPIETAMAAQAQFVSDASHELRTPLTAIQTSNEVALRRPKLTIIEARELIAQNTEDVKKLKQLSDALLNLAQHSEADLMLHPVSLQEIVSDAMTAVVPQALARNITVHDAVPSRKVVGDRASLVQVVVILLDNAVKYSPTGGNVFLESRVQGKNMYLDVRDEGIGIDAKDLPNVFRRFYRADNARTAGDQSGYGLGLAIAEQIVQAQGGQISVVSMPGAGSTFSIKLPVANNKSLTAT